MPSYFNAFMLSLKLPSKTTASTSLFPFHEYLIIVYNSQINEQLCTVYYKRATEIAYSYEVSC